MVHKLAEKKQALELRKEGLSYREILERIPVAKSTLSLWLRSVGLSRKQQQRLTAKKLAAMRRGWARVRAMRIERLTLVRNEARREAWRYFQEPFWLIGSVLYWAEGTKPKKSQGVCFSNMDPLMARIFQLWLKRYLGASSDDLVYEIYIHAGSESRLSEIKKYWSRALTVPEMNFRVYYKRHNLKSVRNNVGSSYYGLVRIAVRKSSHMNHKIRVWIDEISRRYCGVV